MKKWVCSVCGYVYEGENPPAECPVCHVGADKFVEQKEDKSWAAEHVVGVGKSFGNDVPEEVRKEIIDGLRANFEGECSEVGMYLAMARVAHREGYPEIGLYWEKAGLEEAEHAAKFAELLGEVITDSTEKNLQMRVDAENGATMGKFELANKGILFLDEITNMPFDIQAKLLRALQERKIVPIGGSDPVPFDVQVIAATNKDIVGEIEQGTFRRDLFYRLNVIRLHIPPLRQRPEDILPLAHRFLTRFCEEYHKDLTLSPRLLSYLEQCPWPGNVRQLENMMERLVICAQDPVVDIGVLSSEQMGASPLPLPAEGGTLAQQMETFEGHIIRDAYAKYGTSVAVAKALGISQPTAARKIAKYVK